MLGIHCEFEGKFKLELIKSDGEKRVVAEFSNLITNGGLDRMSWNAAPFVYCVVGSGNTAPAYTDTQLASKLSDYGSSYGTVSQSYVGTAPVHAKRIGVYRFTAGKATGNISEVGMAFDSTGVGLFSRALIVDSNGSPTTITKLSDETLDVTYELRRYIPVDDITGTFMINAVEHSYTGRTANISGSRALVDFRDLYSCSLRNGSIGPITGYPSGTYATTNATSSSGYTNGTYYADVTASFSLTQGNLSGYCSALEISWRGEGTTAAQKFQYGVSPDIEKTSSDVMSLTFRISWGRKELPIYKTIIESGLGSDSITVT